MKGATPEPMTVPASQPLRDEHRALLPELGGLRAAADAVGSPTAQDEFDRALRLLHGHLLPHMDAEEAVLYPAIDRIAGHDATAMMRHHHDEIRRRITELEAQSPHTPGVSAERERRAALYGLDAIVRLHLATEEDLFHPLLDARLSDVEATEVIAAIHQIERQLYAEALAECSSADRLG